MALQNVLISPSDPRLKYEGKRLYILIESVPLKNFCNFDDTK